MIAVTVSKSRAFIRKDFIIETSYKMAFLLSLLGSIFPILSFFFIDRMIADSASSSLSKYGGKYFPFALIGVAFLRYFQLAVTTFSESMRRAQMAGCLEAILSSQTSPQSVVLMSSFYSFISAGIQLIIMVLFGVVFLEFSFEQTNIIASLVVLILSVIVFISLGIVAAAGTILFKKGDPFSWLFGSIGGLLGGAFYPVDVMPDWLQYISLLFPITYSLDALRLTILQGYSLSMVSQQLIILSGIALLLFPLSLWFFKWAVEKGKRNGSLIKY